MMFERFRKKPVRDSIPVNQDESGKVFCTDRNGIARYANFGAMVAEQLGVQVYDSELN